jgi:uncharacterized membrane protein
MNSRKTIDVGKMVRLAVLVGIVLLLAYTPLGYLRTPFVEITFLMIPVAVGAIIIGPKAGAFLGGVFGLTSFIQCFGASQLGVALLAINPVFTFIMCMVPRILAGWIPGLIFRAFNRKNLALAGALVASFAASALNTILFVGALILFFYNTEPIRALGDSVIAVVTLLITMNALVEAIACTVVAGGVSRALLHFAPLKPKPAKQ